jgi:uncharacterized membrane protein
MSKTRIEAFSDGVFAVAATILVFNVHSPDAASGHLAQKLLDEWPSYAAYFVSFATIVVIWVNHHAVLDAIRGMDRTLMFLNGLLLLTIAAIPFPTGLLAQYLQQGHDQQTATVAYGLTMSAMAVAFTLVNIYARSRRMLTVPFSIVGFSTGLLLFPLATLVALFNSDAALVIYAGTTLFYIALPLFREARTIELRSGSGAAPRLAHEGTRAAESHGSDLGEDS